MATVDGIQGHPCTGPTTAVELGLRADSLVAGQGPVEVAPSAHGPTWWGTDRLVEAVAEPCPFCGATDHDAGRSGA